MPDFWNRHRIRTLLTAAVAVLILLTLAFIWGNSLQSVEASEAESNGARGIIGPLLEHFVGKGNVDDYLVRKMAHVIEYSVLGCELAVLAILRGRLRMQTVLNGLFAGLAVAVTDEALQMLTGRGPMVGDVLLDFSGVTASLVMILGINVACVRLRRQKRE